MLLKKQLKEATSAEGSSGGGLMSLASGERWDSSDTYDDGGLLRVLNPARYDE